jgi:hypothetical protein
MSLALLLAWLLPLAAGVAMYAAMNPRRDAGWIAAMLGYGCVFGMLLAGAAVALFARADTAHALRHAAPWLGVFALGLSILAWWRARGLPRRAAREHLQTIDKWKIALVAAAVTSLAWRGWIALREILLRPTFPWDAWDAWAVKSKTWFLLGHYVPFVSMRDWLLHLATAEYTGPAWSYPAALGWMQVWFASAAGGWIEPLVNLPWFGLWLGLLLAHYGQWRALGLKAMPALAFVYLLGSLPLLTAHVALAGYADLWIAALFGMAVLAWLRWLEQGDRNQLALALVCALSLPLLKLEGAVWLLLFLGVVGAGLLPRRGRRYIMAAILVLLVLGMAVDKLVLPLFGLGWVNIGLHEIDVPVIGKLAIAWHGAALAGLLRSLYVQSNWNLLWWLAPAIVLWRWRELREHRSLRLLGSLLLAGIGFLLFLFLFTDAARWAESYTAINRLIMHIVPAVVTLLALCCRNLDFGSLFKPVRMLTTVGDTAPASAAPPDPA